MKRTEIDKLRAKSAEELTTLVGEMRETMLKARISRSLQGKQVGVAYRTARRQIARVETLLGQRQRAAASSKKT
jgi:ribosomal protein L29